jgi:hypothetical protein
MLYACIYGYHRSTGRRRRAHIYKQTNKAVRITAKSGGRKKGAYDVRTCTYSVPGQVSLVAAVVAPASLRSKLGRRALVAWRTCVRLGGAASSALLVPSRPSLRPSSRAGPGEGAAARCRGRGVRKRRRRMCVIKSNILLSRARNKIAG